MNAPVDSPLRDAQRVARHIAAACARIAPTWPLDRFIAVNPYWGWVGQPMASAAAALGTLAGTRLTLPRADFRAHWQGGRLQRRHLRAALQEQAAAPTASLEAQVDALVAALYGDLPAPRRLPLLTDLRDAAEAHLPGLGWADRVTHQTSQHCAACFDRHQAGWQPDDTGIGLYASWRDRLGTDRGLPWRQGRPMLRERLAALPATPQALVAAALDALAIPEAGRTAYLSAVLMAISGWAAWCAQLRWQARLAGGDDDPVEQLLAIRLAWEWLLHDDAAPGALPAGWAARWGDADATTAALQAGQHADWLLQRALELAYQQPLAAGLACAPVAHVPPAPKVQAVFCIDVRSEVLRRALETVNPAVHTHGFAGFFGLPIAYSPLGSALTRPQLPGLLAPAQCVTEAVADETAGPGLGEWLAGRRRAALQWRTRWDALRSAPASAFSVVEALGLGYGAALVADSLPSAAPARRWEDTGLPARDAAALRPRLPLAARGPAAAAALAHGILRAMGLVRDFAPLVLLVGHGSQSANNPHAAGLDCGACGGQTGEVNARVLADLLNNPAVRAALRERGVDLPAGTHVLPALHNTTTDEVVLHDLSAVPAALQAAVDDLRGWLAAAGERARAERAPSLGLATLAEDAPALRQALRARANDWAQVRPEWGLADNAAFVVAPRARTRHLDLAGRCFLHDYDWQQDTEGSVLTLIMTAPMVVTHWINMQYHASAVDNARYGSGDKTLHNVVGGRIGVFEGNGGDLRIGLPLQSLHDGQALRHTPRRLSVCIEAPQPAIDAVLAAHETVRQLVQHGWLHLLQIEPGGPHVARRTADGWAPFPIDP